MAKFMQASSSREWMPAWVIPCGLQARSVGVKVPADPAQVLAVDAVGGEGAADQVDDRHAPVAQPAVHVLAGAAHRAQTLPAAAGSAGAPAGRQMARQSGAG